MSAINVVSIVRSHPVLSAWQEASAFLAQPIAHLHIWCQTRYLGPIAALPSQVQEGPHCKALLLKLHVPKCTIIANE